MSTRAIRVGAFVAALVVVLAPRDGAAQTAGESWRGFAGAVVAGNFDNSAMSSGGAERTGGALAIGVTLGKTFADRWSVQVEGEWPTSDQTAVSHDSCPPYTYTTRGTTRTPTVAVLFGVHGRPSKRVDVAFQFGPALRHEIQNVEGQSAMNGVVTGEYQSICEGWLLGVSLGGDVAVNVTPRMAVVGQLRVHLGRLYVDELWAGTVVRPAIGVRIRF